MRGALIAWGSRTLDAPAEELGHDRLAVDIAYVGPDAATKLGLTATRVMLDSDLGRLHWTSSAT